jgi:hypothetical protein
MVNIVLPPDIPEVKETRPVKIRFVPTRKMLWILVVILAVAAIAGSVYYAYSQGYLNFNLNTPKRSSVNNASPEAVLQENKLFAPMVLTDASTDTQFKVANKLDDLSVEALYMDKGNVTLLKKDGTTKALTSLSDNSQLKVGSPTYDNPKFVDKTTWMTKKCTLDTFNNKICGLYTYDLDGKQIDVVVEQKMKKDDPDTIGIYQASIAGNKVAFTVTASGNSMSGEVHLYDRSSKSEKTLIKQTCASPSGRGGSIDDTNRLEFYADDTKLLYDNTTNSTCKTGELDMMFAFDVAGAAKLYSSKPTGSGFLGQANWLSTKRIAYLDTTDPKTIPYYDLSDKLVGKYLIATESVHYLRMRGDIGIFDYIPEAGKGQPSAQFLVISEGKEKYKVSFFIPTNFVADDYVWGSMQGYCKNKSCPDNPFSGLGTDGSTVYQFSTGTFFRAKGLGNNSPTDLRI